MTHSSQLTTKQEVAAAQSSDGRKISKVNRNEETLSVNSSSPPAKVHRIIRSRLIKIPSTGFFHKLACSFSTISFCGPGKYGQQCVEISHINFSPPFYKKVFAFRYIQKGYVPLLRRDKDQPLRARGRSNSVESSFTSLSRLHSITAFMISSAWYPHFK